MPTPKDQFSFIDTGKYVSGQATKVFVSKIFPQQKEPPYKEVTLASNLVNGDTFIVITEPLDITLYEWTKLRLVAAGVPQNEDALGVFVFRETPAGATVIPIYPANGRSFAGLKFRITSYIPVFSARSVNIDNQSTIQIDNNFSDLEVRKAITGVTAKGTIEGAYVFGDPGHKIIQEAVKKGQMVQLEVVTSDRKKSDTARVFLSANKQKGVDQFITMTYTWFADRLSSENILTEEMIFEFKLSSDTNIAYAGEQFTITLHGPASIGYTITGVESADISGVPLTGTFAGDNDAITFTAVPAGRKFFTLTLDNNEASIVIEVIGITNSLSATPSTVNQNESFVVTFGTNYNWIYGYTITGVTSADINGLPLTGTFNNDGDTLTLTATNTIDKAFTLALDNGNDSVNVIFDYVPQLYQLTSDVNFVANGDTFTITFVTDDQESASFPYTITGVTSADINNAPLIGTLAGNGDTATFTATSTGKSFNLSLNNGKAFIQVEFLNQGIYCAQDITKLFAPTLTGTGVYCSQNIDVLFASPLTGTGVYCAQDLTQL